jgi:hypothetical protein
MSAKGSRKYGISHVEEYKRRHAQWLADNGPCKKCGSAEFLDIDHIDPKTKKHNPQDIWHFSEKKRAKELAKCQVLCLKCHREKSRLELAKLTWVDVEVIKKRVAAGETLRSVGLTYGVHNSTISRIVTGKRWAMITSGVPPQRLG